MAFVFVKINDKDKAKIVRHVKTHSKYRSLTHFVISAMETLRFQDGQDDWRYQNAKVARGGRGQ